MPTVIATKDGYAGVYGMKKKGDSWKASPRQARIMEEAKQVQVISDKKAEKIEKEAAVAEAAPVKTATKKDAIK